MGLYSHLLGTVYELYMTNATLLNVVYLVRRIDEHSLNFKRETYCFHRRRRRRGAVGQASQ